ncbi:MAG TPA: TadE/TadG family type IV pilus assembly protein, partial [Anaerolineales bacterium]|nr:TadE/TadG family type IV pilus assembly protein [Anaerolineales bacterium]
MKFIPSFWFKRKARRKAGAQAMLEFALVLPILLLLLLGIIEFGRLFYAWIIIENATRFGVRYASAGTYENSYCSDVDGNSTPCGGDSENEEVDAARLPSIKDETRRMIIGFFYDESFAQTANEYLQVTVCSTTPDHGQPRVFTPPQMGGPIYSACAPTEDPGGPGDRVIVAADYNFTFIVLPALGIRPNMIHLASYREGIVEQFRVGRVVKVPPTFAVPTVPTNTPLPTDTPTPTDTPGPTSTPTDTPLP